MALITTFPVDLTGRSPINLVSGEEQLLLTHAGITQRVLTLDNGGFYTQGLMVYDAAYNLLTPNVDYVATYVYADASQRVGMEICGALVVLNNALTGSVFVTAQMVGGDYAFSLTAKQDTVTYLQGLGGATPVWAGYIGVEPQWSDGELTRERWSRPGYQRMNTELERIAQALMTGDAAAAAAYRSHVQAFRDAFVASYSDAGLNTHVARIDRPHQENKVQLGLGLVANLPVANETISRLAVSNSYYQTPWHVYHAIDEKALKPMYNHRDRFDNPHGVTAAQLGAYTKAEANAVTGNYLDRTQGSVDTYTLASPYGGLSYNTVVTFSRSNLDAGNFTTGIFEPTLLGLNTPSSGTVLRGDGSWVSLNSIFEQYQRPTGTRIIYAGQLTNTDNAISQIATTYSNITEYPVGTVAFYRTSEYHQVGSGNGSSKFYIYPMRAAVRTSSGWINI